MAKCIECNREVGCSCNLIGGKCLTCQTQDGTIEPLQKTKKSTSRIVYSNNKDTPPNTEFESILKQNGISKEEKLRRINEILERARINKQNSNDNK